MTPGPWTVSVKKHNRICGPDGVIIAETWRPPARAKKGYNFAAWAQAHANATLVAAAPDLLRALKYCVIERSEWLEEARAAIAKAEVRINSARNQPHEPTPTANKTRA
jgi:hypothetical protein